MNTKLLEQYHPDMNKGSGAEDKFKEISAAYEVLIAKAYVCVVLIVFVFIGDVLIDVV